MKRLTALTLSAALTSALTVAPSAWADKPEWAGNKEKPSAEQVDAHKAEMKAKRGEAGRGADEDSHYADKKGKELKDKELKDKTKDKSKEKYKDKKQMREHAEDGDMQKHEMKQERDRMHQEPMHQDKAADPVRPQQSEGKSRKWWKFWGEE